jgi:hypothetical protein
VNNVTNVGFCGMALVLGAHHYETDGHHVTFIPDFDLFFPCYVFLVENGSELLNGQILDTFEENFYPPLESRIIEIMFTKQELFEKWPGRIAQCIFEFTTEPEQQWSLQNISEWLQRVDRIFVRR